MDEYFCASQSRFEVIYLKRNVRHGPDEFRQSSDPYVRAFSDRKGAEAALDNQLNVV